MAMTPFSFRESKSGLWIRSTDAIKPVNPTISLLSLVRCSGGQGEPLGNDKAVLR